MASTVVLGVRVLARQAARFPAGDRNCFFGRCRRTSQMSTAAQSQMATSSLLRRIAFAGASRARVLSAPRAVGANVSFALFGAAPRTFAAASARSMASVSRASAFRSVAAMAMSDESSSGSSAASPETTLFVGNLPWSVTDQSLKDVFGSFNPTNCKVVTDKETGRSKGIAFVNFNSENDAMMARDAINGKARRCQTLSALAAGSGRHRRAPWLTASAPPLAASQEVDGRNIRVEPRTTPDKSAPRAPREPRAPRPPVRKSPHPPSWANHVATCQALSGEELTLAVYRSALAGTTSASSTLATSPGLWTTSTSRTSSRSSAQWSPPRRALAPRCVVTLLFTTRRAALSSVLAWAWG